RGQPVVELDQRLGADAVPATRPVDPDGHKPRVAQHAEVLRRLWLSEPDRFGELTDQVIADTESVEDRSPDRLSENLERGEHGVNMPHIAYTLQGRYTCPGSEAGSSVHHRTPFDLQ